MSIIEYTIDGTNNKVNKAIERIKYFDPLQYSDDKYYVAYSGGKDSDVIRILCDLANVKYDLVHNHTTLDAPETVYYVRSINNVQIDYPKITAWDLIVKKGMPPTRLIRYCCSELKERGGKDRIVMTGVRWAESVKRKNQRSIAEIQKSNIKEKIMLNNDNNKARQMFENCLVKGKKVLNPIVDWDDEDVWEFLNYYNCESNPLYQCGFKRIGCVGCPMASKRIREKEFIRYPKYKELYINTFGRMINFRIQRGLKTEWKDGEECFDWWVNGNKKSINKNQIYF